jgi:hypothetical protein
MDIKNTLNQRVINSPPRCRPNGEPRVSRHGDQRYVGKVGTEVVCLLDCQNWVSSLIRESSSSLEFHKPY